MSARAQAIVNQIKDLPADEQREVFSAFGELASAESNAGSVDSIRSARGIFAGAKLTEALLESRAEERRRG